MSRDCTNTKAPEKPPPKLTPEVVERLVEESHELRKEFEQRVAQMWTIPPDERQTRSR